MSYKENEVVAKYTQGSMQSDCGEYSVHDLIEMFDQAEITIDELLDQGDVSSLGENIGVKLDFMDYKSFHENKQCRFYARDRGEQYRHFDMCTDELDLIRFADKSCNADYVYLYAYGYWYVYTIEDNTYEFVELEDELYVLK